MTVNELPDREGMLEWSAWKLMCRILNDRGIDVNDDKEKEVVQAITNWGYRLQLLRHAQQEPTLEPLFYSAAAEARLEDAYPE